MKKFEQGEIIVIKGMDLGSVFDPKILLSEPAFKSVPRYHVNHVGMSDLINSVAPFSGIGDISFQEISVISSEHFHLDPRALGSLSEGIINFPKERRDLSPQELLWAIYSLVFLSDNPQTEHPPLLNKGTMTNGLLSLEDVVVLQLIGFYNVKRGWNCSKFRLAELTEKDFQHPMFNKFLIAV